MCSNKLVSTSPIAIQRESVMKNRNTTSTQFLVNLPVFKREIYERWVAQMNVIFKFQDVVEIMNDKIPALKENENDVQ